MRVSAADVTVEIDGFSIIEECAIEAQAGEIVGLVGPNGSGKSTLLRTIYRAMRPHIGSIHVGDEEVWDLDGREAARRTAVVAQRSDSDFEFTVSEIVMMGRIPYKSTLERDNDEDRDIVASSLHRVGMGAFAGRSFSSLSGGEQQRVMLARALAQRTPVLVLDEPTNHLDIRAQLDLLDLIHDIGATTIAALHDLNLAMAYCDKVVVLSAGKVVASGAVADVLTPPLVLEVFGVNATPHADPSTGRTQLLFSTPTHQRRLERARPRGTT